MTFKDCLVIAFILSAFLPFAAIAQSNPRYIRFSPAATKGALYSPDSGPSPAVGILIIHRTSNFMESLACTELSARGYLVLCMNPRSDNNEAAVYWDDLALDARSGEEAAIVAGPFEEALAGLAAGQGRFYHSGGGIPPYGRSGRTLHGRRSASG